MSDLPKPLPLCLIPPATLPGNIACPNPDGVSPYHRGYLERTLSSKARNPYTHGTLDNQLWLAGCMDRVNDVFAKPIRFQDCRMV